MVRADRELINRIVQRFRGGLVFKAHRLFYDSTLGLRVIKKREEADREYERVVGAVFYFCFTLVTGPRRSLILKLSDSRVYAPSYAGHELCCGSSEAGSYLRLIDSCTVSLCDKVCGGAGHSGGRRGRKQAPITSRPCSARAAPCGTSRPYKTVKARS